MEVSPDGAHRDGAGPGRMGYLDGVHSQWGSLVEWVWHEREGRVAEPGLEFQLENDPNLALEFRGLV